MRILVRLVSWLHELTAAYEAKRERELSIRHGVFSILKNAPAHGLCIQQIRDALMTDCHIATSICEVQTALRKLSREHPIDNITETRYGYHQ